MSTSSSSFQPRLQLPILCDCGTYVKVGQSWTDKNPGRTFYCCPNVNSITKKRICQVWKWADDGMTIWQRDIILRLKNENSKLLHDLDVMRNALVSSENEARKLQTEVVLLKCKRGVDVVEQPKNRVWFIAGVVVVLGVCISLVVASQS